MCRDSGSNGLIYCLPAFAIPAAASCELIPGVLMNAVTTSNIAPLLAGGMAISWAQLGTNFFSIDEDENSSDESLAHWSNLDKSIPSRTGMEPLFRLKTS